MAGFEKGIVDLGFRPKKQLMTAWESPCVPTLSDSTPCFSAKSANNLMEYLSLRIRFEMRLGQVACQNRQVSGVEDAPGTKRGPRQVEARRRREYYNASTDLRPVRGSIQRARALPTPGPEQIAAPGSVGRQFRSMRPLAGDRRGRNGLRFLFPTRPPCGRSVEPACAHLRWHFGGNTRARWRWCPKTQSHFSSRSAWTAAIICLCVKRGAGIDQKDAGSAASGKRSLPAAARASSSASGSPACDKGTILAIGTFRSRTKISCPCRTSLRYRLNSFFNAAMLTLRKDPPVYGYYSQVGPQGQPTIVRGNSTSRTN
jgi:hypothetical protein